MKKSKVVFTGGGTGGHVYPNIAIYEAFREKHPDSAFLYMGTKNGAEKRIISGISQPIEFVTVLSRGIPQKIKSLKTLVALVYIFIGFVKSFLVLRRFKPDIVIGTGGYVAAPVLLAASLLKCRIFIHEQNAVPGRLNRFIARFATRIGVTFSSSSQFFPEEKVVLTGYPLRRSIVRKKQADGKEKYNIPRRNKVVFISGGSSGARTINNAMIKILDRLLEIDDLTVIISTGRGYSREYRAFDDTMASLQDYGTPTEIDGRLIIREYFDNIDDIYSMADLVVTRAGAGTIKEITTLGIPSILIPKIDLPGDHQILNANEVKKIGGAEIVYEEVRLESNQRKIVVPEWTLFRTIKKLLADPDALGEMRRNLKKIDRGDSIQLILKEIEKLVSAGDTVEERRVKVFYLQVEKSEKSHELIFDSTTLGNSILCDLFLEGLQSNVVFKIKNVNNDEKLILKRIRGRIQLNGEEISSWSEIRENDRLRVDDTVFLLKSYVEKVERFQFEKPTSSNIWGSSVGIMVSRLGGFFREVVFAALFGAGKTMGIFAVGLTISNFMRRVVAENALENAFLPIFMRLFHRGSRKKTWKSASSIVNFSLFLATMIVLVGVLITPWLIENLFPAFGNKGVMTQAINMTRIMFPYLILVTCAAVLTTLLKAFNRFGIAESSALFFSLGTIFGVLVFRSFAGIYSLAYGVLLGGVFQILFLFPWIVNILKNRSLQFSYSPAIQFNSPSNRKYYSQVGPISIDVMFANTTEIVAQILASGLKTGAIAFLYFAKTIFRLPFAIISQAINSVILKEFSDRIALFNKEKAERLFHDGIKTNLFLLTPISVFMIILAHPIVSLVYQRGEFGDANVVNTAFALQFYAVGLIGWGIHSFTVRIFSARMDIKTSMIFNFFMLGVNILLCLLLVRTELTFGGLALATSISYLLFSVIRVGVLKVKLERENIKIDPKDIVYSFLKTLLASIFMVVVLIEAKLIFRRIPFGSRTFGNIILLISLLFIGTAVYLLISLMLRNTEILILRKSILRKDRDVPVSMLSPFGFLNLVSESPDSFREDYFYKINIYISSGQWEVRNVGVKLVGLFRDISKVDFLLDLLKSNTANGFLKRNALISLNQLHYWDNQNADLVKGLLDDPYYEVRTAAIDYLVNHLAAEDYGVFRELIHQKLRGGTLEEKINALRLIAKVGTAEDIPHLERFYLSSNSILREELVELLKGFARRGIISRQELKKDVNRILMTSNNLKPEFKLKDLINSIYKEFQLK